MTELKLIPKPEGYELRDKRSDKANDGALWTPRDALFDASQRMGEKTESMLCIWCEKNADGSLRYKQAYAGTAGARLDLLVTLLGISQGWVR